MKLFPQILGLALLAGALPATAAINTLDNVPAATLLLPYFEVDPIAANGQRTVVTLGSVAAVETLAHVTLWTDRGVPSYSFDVRLPARGVTEIDLRAIFASGTLPASTPGGFASCAGTLPAAALTPTQITGLRNAHTGQASSLLGNQCGGASHGDAHARGYVTIDAVASCGSAVPGDAGYFVAGGTGVATNANVLWGEQATVLPADGVAYGDALVHIEASATNPATDGVANPMPGNAYPNDYTFYGRLVGGSAADNREGLPSGYMSAYDFSAAFYATQAQVWRDPGDVAPFACNAAPAPLGGAQVVAFDNEERISVDDAALQLPYATQSIDLGNPSEAAIPYGIGFLSYGLGTNDPLFQNRNQGYVANVYRSNFGGAGQSAGWGMGPLTDTPTNAYLQVQTPQCRDGVDNDSDGLVDFPNDPGCVTADSFNESPSCSNGTDDDGDGVIDFPADIGCRSAADTIEDNDFQNQCSDGTDNDGDGVIDFPADSNCSNPNDQTEAPGRCSDGVDNDMDGSIDFPADANCTSPSDDSEEPAVCANGIDDDGDGLIDFPADTGCQSTEGNNEFNSVCNDGIDNDGDGFTDFPADVGCTNINDGGEENAACNDGVDNDGDGLIDFPSDPGCQSLTSTNEQPQCNDGDDNDKDGFTDFPADIGCSAAFDTQEFDPPQCTDGVDNDGDGLIDFPLSPGCTNANDVFEGADCNDAGVDNDLDGLADFGTDPGCASATDYNELANATDRACSDGLDNDGDGLTDYPADTGCRSAWDDVEFVPAGLAPVIVVQPTTLPPGSAGVAYSQMISASGGVAPYTFLVVAGTLPAGLTLTSDGTLAGTPTEAGDFAITIEATDANDFSATQSYILSIAAPSIVVAPPALADPTADAGVPYAAVFTASGGVAPYTFSIVAGALPTGLTLAADGTLSGTPTAAGAFNFTVQAMDANGFTGLRAYALTVSGPVIDVTPDTLPAATEDTPYNAALSAAGGVAPYTFTLASGALPAGVTLSAAGVLSGMPTAPGNFNFTVLATDANGFGGTQAYALVVAPGQVTPAVPPTLVPVASTWSLLALMLLLGVGAMVALRRR